MKVVLIISLIIIVFLTATSFGQNIWQAAFVLPNLLPQNKIRPLDWLSKEPMLEFKQIPYNDGYLNADLYIPKNGKMEKVLLAIHGANEKGKDDPRIANLAQTFAKTGIGTLTPTFPDITREKFTPESISQILAAYNWLIENYKGTKSGMISFSVAGGPMFIASANPKIQDEVDYLVSFGGYYELKTVLKNVTTGTVRDPFGNELISQQYLKFFGPNASLQNLLNNTDPEKFETLYQDLSPEIKTFIEDLTPAPYLSQVNAKRVFLIHSDPDYIIPVSEVTKLNEAIGDKSQVFILKSFSHVNVQFPNASINNILNYYIPETLKIYRLIFKIFE